MKIKELAKIVRKGIFPVIQFNKDIEVSESIFDENMRGRLVSFLEKDNGMMALRFEINEFESYNITFMNTVYYDKNGKPTMKAIETNFYPKDGIEEVYFYPEDEFPGNIIEENRLISKYIASGTNDSYHTWLEKIVMDNHDAWIELENSLENDVPTLEKVKEGRVEHESVRLGGKIEGVKHTLERIRRIKQEFNLDNGK